MSDVAADVRTEEARPLVHQEPPATWQSVAQDVTRGTFRTIWTLIDRERLGAALAFFVLLLLGGVALVLAIRIPAEGIAPILEGLLGLIAQQWAVAALVISLAANGFQALYGRRISATMQKEIDRQAAEKRDLQVILVPQLGGRSSKVSALESSDDR